MPKVAVLDAVLPEGMEKQVAIGVTEKISEELVASGKYTVLDRTTVGQSLKEIEFQMSGIVSDADIKKAGEQLNTRLGATYVVVARVSQLAGTYFVSAKLIDIKTGEITAQASYELEGSVAVTLQIAQVVGKKLALGAKEINQVPEEQVKIAAGTKPAVQPPAQPPAQTGVQGEIPALRSTLTIAYLSATPSGAFESDIQSPGNISPSTDTLGTVGWDLRWQQFIFGGLYFATTLSYYDHTTDFSVGSTNYSYLIYSSMDVQGGVGFGIPIGSWMQVYAGVSAGYLMLTMGPYWGTSFVVPGVFYEGDIFDAIIYGAEIGFDMIFFDFLPLTLRIAYSLDGNYDYFGVTLGVGFAY
jgi:TolB-like protein